MTHILLSSRLQRGLIPMPCDFFNKKRKSNLFSYKPCTFHKVSFEMFVQGNVNEYILLRNLHDLDFTRS